MAIPHHLEEDLQQDVQISVPMNHVEFIDRLPPNDDNFS